MDSRIDIIKGLHPSKFVERELKKQNIFLDTLAKETGIPYEKINTIITEKHNLTIEEISKIEDVLKIETGLLTILLYHYGIVQAENQRLADLYPTPPSIRKSLFWDADFDKINWGKIRKLLFREYWREAVKKKLRKL